MGFFSKLTIKSFAKQTTKTIMGFYPQIEDKLASDNPMEGLLWILYMRKPYWKFVGQEGDEKVIATFKDIHAFTVDNKLTLDTMILFINLWELILEPSIGKTVEKSDVEDGVEQIVDAVYGVMDEFSPYEDDFNFEDISEAAKKYTLTTLEKLYMWAQPGNR